MGRISEIFPVGACNAQQCQYSVSYFFLDGSCRGRGGGNFHVTKCFAFLCILVEADTEATCYKDTFGMGDHHDDANCDFILELVVEKVIIYIGI
jgi:hypothetical protein